MPERALRFCSKCHRTATVGNYCDQHQGAKAAADKARKDADPLRPFYNCVLWRRTTRNDVLYRCEGRCQELTDGARCPLPAVHVHHVIPAERWVDLGHDFYSTDNLVGLCDAHHTRHTVARRDGREDNAEFAPPDNGFSPVI